MPKPAKGGFYAVSRGKKIGVFSTWDACEEQVKGFHGAKYKKFMTIQEAENYVNGTESNVPAGAPSETTLQSTPLFDKGKKRAISPNIEDESGWDVVYCDGACKGNGKRGSVAGVGVWWEDNDPRNIAERCPGEQTNNRAELIGGDIQAMIRVLETTPLTKRPLLIKSDSQYSINCFKLWLPNWFKNGFRTATGAPVKNEGIIKYLSALIDARARYGQKLRLQYVKGHSGERGNDGADHQANLGALLPAVEDRDWSKLEEDAITRAEEDSRNKTNAPRKMLMEVEGEVVPLSVESPAKVRKTRRDTQTYASTSSESLIIASKSRALPKQDNTLHIPQETETTTRSPAKVSSLVPLSATVRPERSEKPLHYALRSLDKAAKAETPQSMRETPTRDGEASPSKTSSKIPRAVTFTRRSASSEKAKLLGPTSPSPQFFDAAPSSPTPQRKSIQRRISPKAIAPDLTSVLSLDRDTIGKTSVPMKECIDLNTYADGLLDEEDVWKDLN